LRGLCDRGPLRLFPVSLGPGGKCGVSHAIAQCGTGSAGSARHAFAGGVAASGHFGGGCFGFAAPCSALVNPGRKDSSWSVARRLQFHLLADFCEESRLALELAGEGFDGAEGGRADMVLHAFDIVKNHLLIQAEELEEIGKQMMAVGDVAGQGFARGGEDQAAVFLVFEEALGVEALDHIGDAGLGNTEAGGDIDHAGVALGIDEIEDALQVILDGGGGAEGGGGIFARHKKEDRRKEGGQKSKKGINKKVC